METEEILDSLREKACALKDLQAPAEPGVYGFFLADGSELPGIAQPGKNALYIGTSGNLAQREFETHFADGKSGFSTLRRSLGALFIDDLDLRPQPRGPGTSRTNFTNYKFDDRGEAALSRWMHEHLRVAVHPVAEPDSVERELISLACPPLNLKGWANPDGASIKAARKACADTARASRPV